MKIGDKITMRDDLVVGESYNGLTLRRRMYQPNKEFTVRNFHGKVYIAVDESIYTYGIEMFKKQPTQIQQAIVINGETYTHESLLEAIKRTKADYESQTDGRDKMTEHLKEIRKWQKTLEKASEMIGDIK